MKFSATVVRRCRGKAAIFGLIATIGCHRNPPAAACVPYPQLGPVGSAASLPTVVDAPKSEALLIGSVADSLTGQIMHGARVLLIQLDSQHRDTVAAITEADGQFTLRGIRPGRYQYRVLAVGFQQRRGMVELAPGLDTLQVKLKQGLALCDVRATN